MFEVDQPDMSLEKQHSLTELGVNSDHVTFVPCDFNRSKISEVLFACEGFDRTRATFFLWEGVQVYLRPETVDETFAEVRAVAKDAKAAYLWLTLADIRATQHQGSASQGKSLYGASQFYEYAARMGERVMSGIDPRTLPQYLEERGYELYDGAASYPGHMTPSAKDKIFLLSHELIRTSEVFHNALCRVVQ